MKVIAISGWRGSGKDTAADYMAVKYGIPVYSFAAELKEMVANQYHLPKNMFYDPDKKNEPLTTYPVLPKDPFSAVITEFMDTEFSTLDGQQYWTPRTNTKTKIL